MQLRNMNQIAVWLDVIFGLEQVVARPGLMTGNQGQTLNSYHNFHQRLRSFANYFVFRILNGWGLMQCWPVLFLQLVEAHLSFRILALVPSHFDGYTLPGLFVDSRLQQNACL